jgi:hypothetical protein
MMIIVIITIFRAEIRNVLGTAPFSSVTSPP